MALAKGACSLREEGLLLDYTIQVDDEQFKVHKVIMASVSDYFKAMLTGGMKESQTDTVRLEGFSAGAVSDIINFIYTNELGDKSIVSLKELLDCAMYLQVPSAVEKCSIQLCHKVEEDNCLAMLSVFKPYSLNYGLEYTTEYIKTNIDLVLLNCEDNGMSHEEFLNLIDCWEWSERCLFGIIKRWISHDYEHRKQHVNDLMSWVRFCLMSPSDIESLKLTDLFPDSDGPWRDLIDKAVTYHNLPTHQRVLNESEQTKVRSDPTPVYFLAGDDPEHPTYALDKENSWQGYDIPEGPAFHGWGMHGVEINNFLILYEEAHQWNIFDPRTLTWSVMSTPGSNRKKFALVNHAKQLFLLGGVGADPDDASLVTDTIEKYNFDTDTWQCISSKLPVPLLEARAFSIAGSIYVIGGKTSVGTDTWSARLDCWDPVSDLWEAKAHMLEPKPKSEIQVLELFGENIIIVLDRDFNLQYYKPSANQWSVWRRLGAGLTKLIWDYQREDANKMVVKRNTVFMLNFGRYIDAGGCCEKWTFCDKGLQKVEAIERLPFWSNDPYDDSSFFSFSALLSMAPYKCENPD